MDGLALYRLLLSWNALYQSVCLCDILCFVSRSGKLRNGFLIYGLIKTFSEMGSNYFNEVVQVKEKLLLLFFELFMLAPTLTLSSFVLVTFFFFSCLNYMFLRSYELGNSQFSSWNGIYRYFPSQFRFFQYFVNSEAYFIIMNTVYVLEPFQ